MKIKSKIFALIIIFLMTFNTLFPTIVLAVDENVVGWSSSSGVKFMYDGSKWLKSNGSSIMNRLRGSYSFNERMPKIATTSWKQHYIGLCKYIFPDIGNNVYFDDITTTSNTPNGKLGVTSWYDSPYGVFLDYMTPYVKGINKIKNYTSQADYGKAGKSVNPTDIIQDSIDYAKIQFGKSESVYIATTQIDSGLSDAKIGAILGGADSNKQYPILLNSSSTTIDGKIQKAISDLGVKNIIVLGGIQRFGPTAGLTGKYNMIRCGGMDRQHTQVLLEKLPNSMQSPDPSGFKKDNNGVIFEDRGNVLSKSPGLAAALKTELSKELTVKDGSKIVSATNTLLNFSKGKFNIGQEPNTSSKPVFVMGVESDGYQAYWVCYYASKDGAYVYQYILNDYFDPMNSVTVEYRDIDSNKLIAPSINERVKVPNEQGVLKTYTAKTINKYTYTSTKIISGGVQLSGQNPAKIMVKRKGENRVIFYYKKEGSNPGGGEITFHPYETDWTNKGKVSEGKGVYPVEVKYTGDNPRINEGKIIIHHDEPQPDLPPTQPGGKTTTKPNLIYDYEIPIDVKFELKSINVTGAVIQTLNGTSGVVNITKEGENLQLEGEGIWGEPKYELPKMEKFETIKGKEIPKAPNKPQGQSGFYNLDWTRTEIKTTTPYRQWINNTVPYTLSIDVKDTLSGIGYDEKIKIKDESHYSNNAEKQLTSLNKSEKVDVKLSDGIYEIEVKADDIAGNEHTETYKNYYIDGTTPEISFNINNKIFSEDNGAIKKTSVLGKGESFYGMLTANDNLSGIKSIDYKWTYGSEAPGEGYINIYRSEITFNDRHSEYIEKEVEKPVGDNLYLHVKVCDVAGNYIYKSYGPYEDPIKLKDFQVTDIRDPRWTSVFWKDKEYKDYTGKTFKVNEMAIDKESHPTLKNILLKKGYAFYFDITSEYLYRDNDRIEIKPNFYYIKGNERIRVDCYYNNNNNPLVGFGSKLDDSTINLNTKKYGDVLIGNYSKLILTKGVRAVDGREWKDENGTKGWKDKIQYIDGKEQYWYGKYFIPSSTFCVKAGDEPRPENKLIGGNILVNFEIIAYKNGIETFSTDQMFNYTINQWALEGGPKNSNYKNGDVILYNGKYGADTDIKTRVIH